MLLICSVCVLALRLLDEEEEEDMDEPKAKKSKRSFVEKSTPTNHADSMKRKKAADSVVKKREKLCDISKENSRQDALKTRKREQTSAKESTPAASADRGKRKKTTDDISQAKGVGSSQGLSSSRLASYGLATVKSRKRKGV